MVLVLRLLIYGIITEVADRRHACGNAGTTTTFKRSDGITIICLPLGDNYNDYDGTSTNHHRQKQQQQQQLRSLTLRITTDNNSTVTKSFDGIIPQQQHHLHHHNHKEDDHQGGGWKPKRHDVREENSHKANTKKLNINEDNDGEADEERVKNKKDHHRTSKSSNNFDSSSNVNPNRKGIELKNSKSSEVIFVDDNISNENDDRKNSKKSHKSNDNENNDDNVDNNSNNNLKRNVHSIKSNNENEKRQNFKRPRKKFDSIKIGDLFDENFNNNSNDEHTAGGGQNDDEIEQYIVIKRIRKKKMRKKSADKDDKHLQDDDGDNDGSKLLNVDDVDFVDFDGNRMLRLMSSLKNFNSSVHQDYQNQTFRGSLRNDADNHIGSSSKISSTTTTIKFLDGLNRINSNLANQGKLDHDHHREHYGLNRNRIFQSNKHPMFSVVDAGRLNIDNENLVNGTKISQLGTISMAKMMMMMSMMINRERKKRMILRQSISNHPFRHSNDESIDRSNLDRNLSINPIGRDSMKIRIRHTRSIGNKRTDSEEDLILKKFNNAINDLDQEIVEKKNADQSDQSIVIEYQPNIRNKEKKSEERIQSKSKPIETTPLRKKSLDPKLFIITVPVVSGAPKSMDSSKSNHQHQSDHDLKIEKEYQKFLNVFNFKPEDGEHSKGDKQQDHRHHQIRSSDQSKPSSPSSSTLSSTPEKKASINDDDHHDDDNDNNHENYVTKSSLSSLKESLSKKEKRDDEFGDNNDDHNEEDDGDDEDGHDEVDHQKENNRIDIDPIVEKKCSCSKTSEEREEELVDRNKSVWLLPKDPKKSSDKNNVRKPSSDFKSVEVTRVVFSNDPKSIDSRKLDTISDHNTNTGGDDRFHKEFRQSYEFRKNTETTEGDLEGFLKHWPKDLQLIKSSTTQNTAHQSNINGRNSQFASTKRFGQDPHRSSNHQINLLRQHQQPKRSPPPPPPWSTSSELFNANNQESSTSNANDHLKNLNSRRPNNKQYFWKMMPTR